MPEKFSEWGALAWGIIVAVCAAAVGAIRWIIGLVRTIEQMKADHRALKHDMSGLKQRQEAVEQAVRDLRGPHR